MKWTTTAFLVFGLLIVLFYLTSGSEERPVAPRTGVIIELTPGSAACWDEQNDSGPRASVSVRYRPDGVDQAGDLWPVALACVTPGVAERLTAGGRYGG